LGVYEHPHRNKVSRRQRGLTKEQIELAGLLYENGQPLAKLGARFNVDAQTGFRSSVDVRTFEKGV